MWNRRGLLKALTASVMLPLPAAESNSLFFFNKDEFALLDHLTEMIIPADEHSPGAHEARVAAYIDRMVAEAFTVEEKDSWRKGLTSINEASSTANTNSFLKSTSQQQLTLLKSIAMAEANPQTPAEKFFTQLKEVTTFVYYSSKVGIHQDTNYKGNVLLPQFVGYDAN